MACITKRRGRWVIDFYDQHGKRRWKTLKEGATKKQARKALREIEEAVDKGNYITPAKAPSFSNVAEMWLNSKRPNIRHSTYRQYSGHVENHLKPYYGAAKIGLINYDSVERFINECQNKNISIPTMKKVLVTLGAILTYACRKRYMDYNPVREIEKPKGQSEHNEDKDLAVIRPPQIRALLNNTPSIKYKTLFMTAIMTGMRQGEIFGFKWDDIDWGNNQINVKRTFTHFRFYEPKTKASRRKIDMAPQLVSQLKKWELACPPNSFNLVFPNGEGKPMNPDNMVKRHFLPALKQARLQRIRFHDLRHTYASLLISQGEYPKYIQNQMGHSSINITMDIYGHLMEDTNPQAASRLGNGIFEDDGSKMVAGNKEGVACVG